MTSQGRGASLSLVSNTCRQASLAKALDASLLSACQRFSASMIGLTDPQSRERTSMSGPEGTLEEFQSLVRIYVCIIPS